MPIPTAMHDVDGFLINQLAERLRTATEEALRRYGIRPRQIGLLLVLHREAFAQQQALGERLGMDRTTTMQLVSALVEQGLLEREVDPDDGRAYRLRLTPRGQRLTPSIAARVTDTTSAVLSALSRTEQRQLRRLLLKALDTP